MPAHDAVEAAFGGERLHHGEGVVPLLPRRLRTVPKPGRECLGRERLGRDDAWEREDFGDGRVRAEGGEEVAVELRDPAEPAIRVRYEREQPHSATAFRDPV